MEGNQIVLKEIKHLHGGKGNMNNSLNLDNISFMMKLKRCSIYRYACKSSDFSIIYSIQCNSTFINKNRRTLPYNSEWLINHPACLIQMNETIGIVVAMQAPHSNKFIIPYLCFEDTQTCFNITRMISAYTLALGLKAWYPQKMFHDDTSILTSSSLPRNKC